VSLRTVPVSFRQAGQFVADWHRHHPPPRGHKFSIGVADGELLVGVAMVGRPVARMLDDGLTLEVTRVATDGHRNACSLLYAAAWQAAKALGYRRLITYTQTGRAAPACAPPAGTSSRSGHPRRAGRDPAVPASTTAPPVSPVNGGTPPRDGHRPYHIPTSAAGPGGVGAAPHPSRADAARLVAVACPQIPQIRRSPMPTTDVTRIPGPTAGAVTARRTETDDTPWSFPVEIVRPATTPLPPLTAVQRDRRRAASLTYAARRRRARGGHPDVAAGFVPWWVTRRQILREAPDLAAAPPPGAVQVGTNDQGRPVAVVLHADRWSLVLHAARIRTYGWQPPVIWVFTDRPDDPDWHGEFGIDYLASSFDDETDVAWTHMVTTVLALTTAPVRPGRPPRLARCA
jgi:hypothetical protein